MADLEPPAKKARLDMDAPSSGPQDLGLDAPGSPVDDLDDDFYETSVAQDTVALPQDALDRGALESKGDAPPIAATEPASAAAPIPGLGHWGGPLPRASRSQARTAALKTASYAPGAEQQSEPSQPALPSTFSPSTTAGVGNAVIASAPATLIPDGDEPKGLKRKASPTTAQDHHAPTPADASVSAAVTHEDDGKAEFLEAAQANKGDKEAEWELDSQASSSSSSDSSSDDSSSDEDGEASDDGELLSPAEMAKRLLEGDLDDDDAGANKTTKVRTQNEVDETYVKPDITVTDDTKITELGAVESIVDNLIVVKAKTSGDYQVLEAGSALCLGDKTIIGQISETIGRVQDPRYSVGFADAAEIATLNITKDTPVFYVDAHSSFVFTEPLRAQKHTDASGQYDEEARVQEFSDDEQEAEHKRKVKAEKKQRAQATEEVPFNPPTGPSAYRERSPPNPSTYTGGGLKYSDDEDEDLGMYKPLARPDRFEDIVGAGAPVEDRSHVRRGMMRGGRGGWMDRGRGFRGRGGGGRGDMRGGAGGGQRNDRGGMGGQRGDRGGGGGGGGGDRGRGGGRGDRNDRGGRAFGGSPERPGRQDEQQQRRTPLPPQQEVRPNFRAQFSPAGSPPRQDVGPSPRANKKRNKKRNRRERERERREQEREQRERSSQPPAAANATAYASNAAQSNSGWNSAPAPAPPAPTQPASYTQPAPAAPAQAPANYYVNPGVYPQQAAAPAPPPPQPQANQAQQWAQWLQMAAYFQQAQQAQGQQAQAAPPPPPPPQPPQPPQPQAYPQYVQQQQQQQPQQPQAQYGYTYSQYQPQAPPQNPTPPADPRLQHHNAQQQQQQPAQATPSIQDILRALGQASGR
ncbi:hypothetical protein GRF29_96g276384 [Pseudopithomyces chartarum]|uniref:H/ACA ribonucleoprotein complex non-core subunit NAF1 n=1 Tax=Pseudopithomyces chartarum TaxID=1892770 RepID=A0AAN6LYP3_9PLEO|nr:hypothetical protein GRF29_96g276384 [Pseudopithomyces chartarum]